QLLLQPVGVVVFSIFQQYLQHIAGLVITDFFTQRHHFAQIDNHLVFQVQVVLQHGRHIRANIQRYAGYHIRRATEEQNTFNQFGGVQFFVFKFVVDTLEQFFQTPVIVHTRMNKILVHGAEFTGQQFVQFGNYLRVTFHGDLPLHHGLLIVFDTQLADQGLLGFQPVEVFLFVFLNVFQQFAGNVIADRFTVGNGFFQHLQLFQNLVQIALQHFSGVFTNTQAVELLQIR